MASPVEPALNLFQGHSLVRSDYEWAFTIANRKVLATHKAMRVDSAKKEKYILLPAVVFYGIAGGACPEFISGSLTCTFGL